MIREIVHYNAPVLRAKGKADQTKGNLKQAGEKLKDAVKR